MTRLCVDMRGADREGKSQPGRRLLEDCMCREI